MIRKFIPGKLQSLPAVALGAVLLASPAMTRPAAAYELNVMEYVNGTLTTVSGYWSSFTSTVYDWLPGMPSGEVLTRQLETPKVKSETDFKYMMNAAGFSVKSIKMGMSVLPKFGFSFGQKREISEADRDYVQKLLRKHSRTHFGPLAAAERLIVTTVLELQGFPDYELTKVDVTMLPFPAVQFEAEPKAVVLGSEASYIVQRVEDINHQLEELRQ